MEDKSNLSLDFQFGLEAGELLDRVQQGQRPGKLVDLQGKIEEAFRTLKQGTGPGHEFLGWMELPGMIENESLEPILDKVLMKISNLTGDFHSLLKLVLKLIKSCLLPASTFNGLNQPKTLL